MHTFQFLRRQGKRLQWSWEPSSSSFRIPSSVWQIRQKTTHEKNNSKYTDEADDDSDRWGNGWRGQGTKSESMKKCKCKHTINCWHKTHKFKRKLNYVTQQLNSIYMVVILAFCSGRVFLSVVAGGRFGERSENCERFSSVSRIRLERKKWQEKRRRFVCLARAQRDKKFTLEWASNDGSFNKCSSLFILAQLVKSLCAVGVEIFAFAHDSRRRSLKDTEQTVNWCMSCVVWEDFAAFYLFFFVDSWKKHRTKRNEIYMRGDEKKNGWGCESRSLVIVINWLYLLFTTSKLNHKNWSLMKGAWARVSRSSLEFAFSPSISARFAFEFPKFYFHLILIWIGWVSSMSSGSSISRMPNREEAARFLIRSAALSYQGHTRKIDKVELWESFLFCVLISSSLYISCRFFSVSLFPIIPTAAAVQCRQRKDPDDVKHKNRR